MEDRRNFWMSVFLMGVLSTLIYANTFKTSFHFDDFGYIVTNPHIRDLGNVRAIWKALDHPVRFVTFITFALNYHCHRLDVFGYHLVNLIIHLLTAIGVWWLLALLLKTPRMQDRVGREQKNLLPLAAALIFLTHPLQTQAVTYITQRFASLATLFYVWAMGLYVAGRLKNEAGNGFKPAARLTGFFICAVLAMFTKEIAMTLPVMVLVVEIFFLKEYGLKELWQKRTGRFFIAALLSLMLMIPVLYSLDVKGMLSMTAASGSHQGETITSANYLLTQGRVLVTYLRLLFLPVNQNVLYDYRLSQSLFEWPTFLSFLLLTGLGAWAFFIRDKHPLVSFGILWFFLTLVVESSVIPIQHVIFEHRLYLPLVGFALALAAQLRSWLRIPKSYRTTLAVVVTAFSFLTFQRNRVWQSEVTLWQDNVMKSPQASKPYLNLANAYLAEGDYPKALANYTLALERDPRNYKAYNSRGVLLTKLEKWDEALADFLAALSLAPSYGEAHVNRGNAYVRMGRLEDAMVEYSRAITFDPRFKLAYVNRGNQYARQGAVDLALADYQAALAIDPYLVEGYLYRGQLYDVLGRYTAAIADFSRALKLDPENHWLLFYRGISRYKNREYALAIRDFDAHLTSQPHSGVTYFNRSLAYRAERKLSAAVGDARKAVALGYPLAGDYLEELIRAGVKGEGEQGR